MRLVLLLALAACSDIDAQPNYAETIKAAQQRMHDRFKALHQAQEGIVTSDLERVHANARTLIALEEPDVLAKWKPFFESIREAARPLADARDPIAASHLVAEVGRRCANCHEAAHAKLPLEQLAEPKADAHLASQMIHHQWAATRMWEGLIAPSADRWNEGARMLAQAPLTITAESSTLGIADDVAKVRLIARRALDPRNDRPTVYGDLLATCAHCHAAIRDR